MKKYSVFVILIVLNIAIGCAGSPGAVQTISGSDCISETIKESPEITGPPHEIPVELINRIEKKLSTKSGKITWSDEDWTGSYGAIADDLAVSGDGSRIYVSWNLNFEKIDAYDAKGTGCHCGNMMQLKHQNTILAAA